ncbi:MULTISPECIES: hypothetical protein [Providencia]|uniref:hypothetical protein n=1 Tax=Providencia TaxID=586 RepID=UPI001E49AC7B|nr:hypothetical protein [Providencia sp. PROV147]UFK95922.1 hypothetical protein LMY39_07035 [Providencia rettgeri]
MTLAEGFSVFGSLASFGAIVVAILIYFFQRNSEEKNKLEIKELKIDAMTRLLAHRAIPMCHRGEFLLEVCLMVLEFNVIKIRYIEPQNKLEFEISNSEDDGSDISVTYLNIPNRYENLNENTLLLCAELSDKKNELQQIAIKMNVGGDSFGDFINLLLLYVKNNNLKGIKASFGKNSRGEYSIIDHVYEVISFFHRLEPEIEHYAMYLKVRNLSKELKNKYISHKN